MSQENHPKPFKVLWEQLLGEDVSHLQGCFAENEENKALFHGLPHKMIVLGNVLSPFFICFSFRNRNTLTETSVIIDNTSHKAAREAVDLEVVDADLADLVILCAHGLGRPRAS